jgi:hypothetical protein
MNAVLAPQYANGALAASRRHAFLLPRHGKRVLAVMAWRPVAAKLKSRKVITHWALGRSEVQQARFRAGRRKRVRLGGRAALFAALPLDPPEPDIARAKLRREGMQA